jgi:hypothetical protein
LIISENLNGLDMRAAAVHFDQSFQKSEERKVRKRAKALTYVLSPCPASSKCIFIRHDPGDGLDCVFCKACGGLPCNISYYISQ